MHPVKRYLESVEEPVADFAARVGTSRQTMYRLISRTQTPRPALARRIVEASGGAVSLGDLYNEETEPAGRGKVSGGSEVIGLKEPVLRVAIASVYNHFAPSEDLSVPEDLVVSAATVTVTIYEALSLISDRTPEQRLEQALSPVLYELLCQSGVRPLRHILEDTVGLCTEMYFNA